MNSKLRDLVELYKKSQNKNKDIGLIEFLLKSLEQINFNRYLKKIKLKNLNLNGQNLEHINFCKSNFYNSDLSNSNLSFSSFFSAKMGRVDLRGSSLIGANLSYVNLEKSDLRKADLSFCILKGVKVTGALFGGNLGITQTLKEWLESKGAIFDNSLAFPKEKKYVNHRNNNSISRQFVRNFGSPGLDLLSKPGAYTQELIKLVDGNLPRAKTLLAMIFWQSFQNSECMNYYFKMLSKSADKFDINKAQTHIIVYGKERRPGFGLNISSYQFNGTYPFAIKKVKIDNSELLLSWEKSVNSWSGSEFVEKLKEIGGKAAIELNQRYDFPLLISSRPHRELTASCVEESDINSDKEYFGVSKGAYAAPDRSIGVFCTKNSVLAITTALHSESGDDAFSRGEIVNVFIKDKIVKGKVVSKHTVTDSCLIQLEEKVDTELNQKFTCGNKPLSEIKILNETLFFYSLSRKKIIQTKLKGVPNNMLDLINDQGCHDRVQVTIQTEPHSKLGDSGTALYNKAGEVHGFCFYRTPKRSNDAHTAWIWANTVFRNHGIL